MVLYMMVTADKYELPMIVADTQKELARKSGLTNSAISKAISQKYRYVRKKYKIIKVTV